MIMMSDLNNQVIAVAGAGGRLGRVLVSQLEEAGASVAAIDLSSPEGLSPNVHGFGADLTSEEAVTGVFEKIEASVGPVDGLVHVVGMWEGEPFVESTQEGWERMMRINLTSTFLCFREAARRMAERGRGRLVAIASRQGLQRGVAQQAAYSASKAGVVRLVEAVSEEFVETDVTAAAVAPSLILFDGDEGNGVAVESVAGLCVYLCGDGGRVHNGEVLPAYG